MNPVKALEAHGQSVWLDFLARGFIARGDLKKLIDELMEAATAPGTSYLHQWREGDVVMWDNRATMHRGRPWPAHEPRLMVRTTISATAADGIDAMHSPSTQAAE